MVGVSDKPIREWPLYQNCAFVFRRRALKDATGTAGRNGYDANPEDVDYVIAHGFDGSESEFVAWANDYTEYGCGVRG